MDKCLLYSDDSDDSDDENNSNVETKTYTPKELNKLLLNNTEKIAENFKNINMIGDIVGCTLWRRSGMHFKLINNKESFECNVWIEDGCDLNKVQKYEDMNCKIIGYIKAKYFYSHKFVLNVIDIELETDDTKLKRLKEQCKEKGYFVNKKNIPWRNIKNIGIISKIGTKGYNDFITQFKIPVPIITEEITLEGKKTLNECIQSITKLQNVDIIIILRGGGDTSEISNSFDRIELFDAIHKSKIPIITAIGHEDDKGDKLLITEVSDLDYPTPSSAAKDITKILLNPILEKIKVQLCEIESVINGKINKEYDKLYNVLKYLFNDYKKERIGGPIMKIEDNTDFIIIEKDGYLYKNPINFNNKMDFTSNEVNMYREIDNAIDDHELKIIEKYLYNITDNKLIENINENITKIKRINKLEDKFKNIKPKRILKLYCKEYNLNSLKINDLNYKIQLYSMVLWYMKIFEEGDMNNKKKIFNYYINS